MLLRQASSSRFRAMRPVLASISLRFVPSGRSLARDVRRARRRRRRLRRRATRRRSSPSTSRGRGRAARARARGRRCATRELVGRSLVALDAERVERTLRALPDRRRRLGRPRLPAHARRQSRRSVRSRSSGAATSSWLVTARGKVDPRDRGRAPQRALPRLWLAQARRSASAGAFPEAASPATRGARRRSLAAGSRHRVKGVRRARRRRADARAAPRDRAPARRRRRRRAQARGRRAGPPRCVERRRDVPRRQRPAAAGRRTTTLKSQVEVETMARLQSPLTTPTEEPYPRRRRTCDSPHVQCELQLEVRLRHEQSARQLSRRDQGRRRRRRRHERGQPHGRGRPRRRRVRRRQHRRAGAPHDATPT